MMSKLKILVVLGTGRDGRMSERVFKRAVDIISKRKDIEPILFDVKDHSSSKTIASWEVNEKTKIWKDLVLETDGLFVISPEYNHSYPGELKILIDSAFKEYVKKPVILCGVSDGNFAGVRVIDAMRSLFSYLGMIVIPTVVPVSKVDENFLEDGTVKDPRFEENVLKALDQFTDYCKLLKK